MAPAPAQQSAAPGDAAVQTVTGPVLETMDASNYTYVRVKTDKGEVWAATSQFKVAVGDRVVVPLETPMENFASKTLNRTFPLIYFTSHISRDGESMTPPPMAIGHGAPGGGAAPASDASPVATPMVPPAGGTTIANVWTDRKGLAGKTVTVRGKVVKFNGGILDRNWLHLQDGTGKAADGTNDLLVTSDTAAKVGEIVTVTGTVAVDKDFTSGYAYKVMLEKAKIAGAGRARYQTRFIHSVGKGGRPTTTTKEPDMSRHAAPLLVALSAVVLAASLGTALESKPGIDKALDQGKQIFRYDTFGDEAFWGDTLKLHTAIEGSRFGGVGPESVRGPRSRSV